MKRTLLASFLLPGLMAGVMAAASAQTPPAAPPAAPAVMPVDPSIVPTIKTEPGFTATDLVPQGHGLYDPLWPIPHNGKVYYNEDGGSQFGYLGIINPNGVVELMGPIGNKFFPFTGFDFAPKSWGKDAGQVYSIAQPGDGSAPMGRTHLVQRITLATKTHGAEASIICAMPDVNGRPGAGGAMAYFGPDGGKFEGRFFAMLLSASTIYQATRDGKCSPFITYSDPSMKRPVGFAFSPDGNWMMVSATGDKNQGLVTRVSPEGKVDGIEYDVGAYAITGLMYAPKTFKKCGGCLYFGGRRNAVAGEPPTGPGRGVFGYIDSKDKSVHVVATGFANRPGGIAFMGNDTVWLMDTNGHFFGGVHADDGYVVKLKVQ